MDSLIDPSSVWSAIAGRPPASTGFLAAESSSGGSGALIQLLILVGMFGVMYLVLIRPQQRRQKLQQELMRSLAPGDRVVASSGLYGTITHVEDECVHLEVDRDVVVRVARSAIARFEDPALNEGRPGRGGPTATAADTETDDSGSDPAPPTTPTK